MIAKQDLNPRPRPDRPTPPPCIALTAVEHTLLHWLAAGLTNAQIADHLKRSEKTVGNQLTGLYAKLGAANRAQAVAVHLHMEVGRRA